MAFQVWTERYAIYIGRDRLRRNKQISIWLRWKPRHDVQPGEYGFERGIDATLIPEFLWEQYIAHRTHNGVEFGRRIVGFLSWVRVWSY